MSNRIMALDIGQKTIGIALSDPLAIIAQPVTTIQRESWEKDLAAMSHLILHYDLHIIVIGLPKNMDGSIGKQAQYVYMIGERIQKAFPNLKIEYVDERLTTVMAEQSLIASKVKKKKRKAIIDQQAAVLILQTFLEQNRHS